LTSNSFRHGFLGGALAGALSLALPAWAMPRLMDLYNDHPRALAQNRDKCVICHVNANGSGRLTDFGQKYEHAGLLFSSGLMAEYPNLFGAGSGSAGAASGPLGATAGANPLPPGGGPAGAPAGAALPGEPDWTPAKFYRAECNKCHGKYADGDPLQGVPAFATRKWIEERLPKTEELMTILMKGKDKMVGMEGKLSEEQARQLLDYVKSIAVQYGS
jgi:predicted CxxxxCH...CXXCH cytochrome family protein